MIVLDVNVVLPLARPDHLMHRVATTWLAEVVSSAEAFGVPNLVWHALVRLATNRKAVETPSNLADVFAFAGELQRVSGYRRAEPGPRHLDIFADICERAEARGNLVTDAAIAAIAIENGAGVASFDRDFARFRSLRWTIPGETS